MARELRASPVLYVCSDPVSVSAFRAALGEGYSVKAVSSVAEAPASFEDPDLAAIVVDAALSAASIAELLERARVLRPEIARLLLADTLTPELAEEAINRGRVVGFMRKPWQPEPLRNWLGSAIEAQRRDYGLRSMEMSLWHGGQVAAATTIYEELVHELSNPLGALEINASLVADLLQGLAEHESASEELRASAATALEAHSDSLAAIEQMKNMVARMRHGRRARPRKEARCDPARIIDATVRVVRAEVERVARLEVVVDASPTLAIEGSVLGQVLLNLLLNAAQAVHADQRATNRIQVHAGMRGERFVVSVTDNGPGIPEGLTERLFEPFFTTKENGTGLGLAICRELVTRARGTIHVESTSGAGARVDVAIPLSK
jgi:signal transduction histidine kinase